MKTLSYTFIKNSH